MNVVVIHGSTRKNGNTEYLTYQAVPKNEGTHIYLRDYRITPITDQRHEEDGFTPADDDMGKLVHIMLQHDILLFSTPIYWYSMSGPMKTFIDRWSQIMRDPKFPHFREELKKKTAYLIAVGGDHPAIKGLPLVQQFQYICQFFDMTFGGYVIGTANKPGQIIHDQTALHAASMLLKKPEN
ncbi:MAG TPA: NAD(P)H-dependent oxidoreductase [Bacillota bacterium]|jgi:multimeric flavodoxin WrbA|nr:NAD(P)H-dependent oxidoreductase [Bacillota bacterium]